jgi:hypothetical protein
MENLDMKFRFPVRRDTLRADAVAGLVLGVQSVPAAQLPANEVVAPQPYRSLLLAAAPVLESRLPAPADASRNSVVILRLRGRDRGAYGLTRQQITDVEKVGGVPLCRTNVGADGDRQARLKAA